MLNKKMEMKSEVNSIIPDQSITTIFQTSGYCVVQREVAQSLRNYPEALGLYVFLLSLPHGWQFRKSWLKKETSIGINKLNKLLKFLSECNLLKTMQTKVKGKFAEFAMEIYDGKNFNHSKFKSLFDSPYHGYRVTETVATEIEHKILNKEKRKNNKKDLKSFRSSDDDHAHDDKKINSYEPIPKERIRTAPIVDKQIPLSHEERRERIERKAEGEFLNTPKSEPEKSMWFEMFWDAYPKKIGRMKAQESWKKKKLEAQGEMIVSDVLDRAKRHSQWQDKQFIPNPATYLNQERWTDEVLDKNLNVINNNAQNKTNGAKNESYIDKLRRAAENLTRKQQSGKSIF